jgi:hypothetical protein
MLAAAPWPKQHAGWRLVVVCRYRTASPGNVALRAVVSQIVDRVLERFRFRKMVLLTVLSSWLPAFLWLKVFGVHSNLHDDGSMLLARTLLSVYLATLVCCLGGSFMEVAWRSRSRSASRLLQSQANNAVLCNFLLVTAVVLLFPLPTLYVSAVPKGMMPVMISQYLRGFPRSAYNGMQGVFVGGTAVPASVILRLNVAPLLIINILSLYRRKGELPPVF